MGKIKFSNSKTSKDDLIEQTPWEILVADDDHEVHSLTKTVLHNFKYLNRPLKIFSSYSGEQTIDVLRENTNIVLVLLDVVMESDDAGLVVVKKIREELKNNALQIILRTGQAGIAPEIDVVTNYAINDYKEKTELTSKKLHTSIITAIRSNINIKELESLNYEREGLLSIFDENVITSKTDKDGKIIYVSTAFCNVSGYTKEEILGNSHNIIKHNDTTNELYHELWSTITSKKVWKGEIKDKKKDGSFYWLKTTITPEYDVLGNFTYYTSISEDITNKKIVEESNRKIEILNNEIKDTQKEVVFRMGAIGEARSKETGMHVKRVAEYSKCFALFLGINEDKAERLKQASPMHDIGKVAIPDNILNKPGKLTPEEFTIMKTHAQLGFEMLGSSNKDILKLAAIVAHEHHEKWDGSGYPRGLSGKNIHIYGRITAVADVFDSLGSSRVYKKAWNDDEIFSYFKEQKGKHFDPEIIDIFFDNLDDFLKIRDTYKDI